jgi:type II secretory pathway pseudopilin PulG
VVAVRDTRRHCKGRRGQAGFTLIGLLVAVALLGFTLATIGVVWSTQIRRDREAELLYIGDQYRAAIGRYLISGGQYPAELGDLVLDKRSPAVRRYLRRIYPDPMTNSIDWDVIVAPQGGIMGVASRSKDKPIKVAGFPIVDVNFGNAECYCDWKFVYTPRTKGRRRAVLPSLQGLSQGVLKALPLSSQQPQPQSPSQPPGSSEP